MVMLVGSFIVFIIFTYMIIREYDNDNIRQEFGYRIWTLGLFAELVISTIAICNIN